MARTASRLWTREEVIKALSLYCVLPFGRFHKGNPDVLALAKDLARTPSSISLKLCNFASFDPHHKARGVAGMGNASKLDREVWNDFYGCWNVLAQALPAENRDEKETGHKLNVPEGPTTQERLLQVRRGQRFFRKAVLSAYADRCCITGIADCTLLRASHIVPWAKSVKNRLNPCNGLCLNALHDAALDGGLLTLDENLRVVLSPRLPRKMPKPVFEEYFHRYSGQDIQRPERFLPDGDCLHIHRTTLFLSD
ncbi:MAG: HNH endonuclease [Planctomycetes bacterium]|nr:HNH endonuclease [Planctomycetota bacterium]